MPSGSTHDKITIITTPLIAISTYLLTNNETTTIITSLSYLFSGLMFSGDLDIKSKQINRWGILKIIWFPYRKIFKHRSFWSHSTIDGTILRIMYVFLWFSLINYIINSFILKQDTDVSSFLDKTFYWVIKYPQYFIPIFIGLLLGAFSHNIADSISSYFKRLKRKLTRKKNKTKILKVRKRKR